MQEGYKCAKKVCSPWEDLRGYFTQNQNVLLNSGELTELNTKRNLYTHASDSFVVLKIKIVNKLSS